MLDTLLDQEGLEVDPVERLEADIPLHKAVRFVNGLAEGEWEAGAGIVELLLDAGADPRLVVATISFFSLFSFSLVLFIHHCCHYSSSLLQLLPRSLALGGRRGGGVGE